MLVIVLLSWLFWQKVQTQMNMYDTDRANDMNNLQVNCLYYINRRNLETTEKIEYCVDSTNNVNSWTDDFLNTRHQNFTFNQLRQMKITVNDLLSWSATIDLAEKYQYYLDFQSNSLASQEIFFNCTEPWFGSHCQYSFPGDTDPYVFSHIIQRVLTIKSYSNLPSDIIPSTCYMHLKCDRGGTSICLDWREICDGRSDCINEGVDEAQCFDLELNECGENEYRCHNGLCIPKEFLTDNRPQCLDQTDISIVPTLRNASYIFDYEEYACRPGYKKFVCGDGRCVADFDTCHSKRHLLLRESISVQGNLSHQCWMIMICLTKIFDQVNGTICDQLLKSSNIGIHLQTCPIPIQFPTVPILFGHVHFLYRLNDIQHIDMDQYLLPTYICYDEQLCHFIPSIFRKGNYSCQFADQFGLTSDENLQNWTSIIGVIEPYFRKCLTKWNQKNPSNHSSLYCCQNSSKCISKHRILDSIFDCFFDDDEKQFDLSCTINDIQRFKCSDEHKCYSSLFDRKEICPLSHLYNFDDLKFQEMCDRNVQMSPIIINGQNHTDETDCEHWPCNNYYTRCDGFWSCLDGDDEKNCTTSQLCPLHTLPCVSLFNYTFFCLPASQVGNGNIDCLGAADELQFCRNQISTVTHDGKFRCKNSDICMSTYMLCDAVDNCPFGDDEIFCEGHYDVCKYSYQFRFNLTSTEQALCNLGYSTKIQFSFQLSQEYPSSKKTTTNQITQHSIERRNAMNFINSNVPDESIWFWFCNHGIYARYWLGNNNFSYRCFCPPAYYGDRCQYQNQRVSFTARVKLASRYGIYAIVVSLFNDDGDREEINSYQQFVSVATTVGCVQNYNVYLTYSKRPKNTSKSYGIRIDIFEKTSLTYIVSWHYSIPFPFLPVNRIAVILDIPVNSIRSSKSCSLTCDNGECLKYMNKEKYFCRCYIGWSGARCHIPIGCNDCSFDSICADVRHNRSICVCPLDKGGPRCLLKFSCPPGICENNGICVVLDDGMNDFPYICQCPEQYYGLFCQHSKNKLEISFNDIEVSSIMFVYTWNPMSIVPDKTTVPIEVIPKKLKIFQRTVTLYFEHHLYLVFVMMNKKYYLAVLQHKGKYNISTSISPAQRCKSIDELLNSQTLALPGIQRMKHYHVACSTHLDLNCFYDEYYMCLCTLERHANCFKFNHNYVECSINNHCSNGGRCLQVHSICQYETTCICLECFFGDRCQFYAQGIGLTLDDILRYAIQSNTTIDDQSNTIKWSSAWTIIMLIVTLINSILSMITFATKESRAVGCGLYLFASSITSLLTICIFVVKYWFVLFTQMNLSIRYSVIRGGCISIEYILKIFLYTDSWLNTCVAFERAVTIYKGINFKKTLSKNVAKFIIIILPIFIGITIIHEPLHRDIFDHKDENRIWCIFPHSSSIHVYNTIISIFHFIGPLCINLFSALFIIFGSAHRRAVTQRRRTYREHLREQFIEHENLIISPLVLIILTIPRLIFTFMSGCTKVSQNVWLYIFGYFVSFIPSMSIFFIFVLPSKFYRKQLQESFQFCHRRHN